MRSPSNPERFKPPAWIFPGQAQYQRSDRVHGAGPASAFRLGLGSVAAGDDVAVPPEYRVRPHQQPHSAQYLPWQAIKERRQERPVARVESNLLSVQLPLQNTDLVAQRQNFDNFLVVAHRQQSQHHERVRHTQVRQSRQHGRSSCRRARPSCQGTHSTDEADIRTPPTQRLSPGRMRFSARAASIAPWQGGGRRFLGCAEAGPLRGGVRVGRGSPRGPARFPSTGQCFPGPGLPPPVFGVLGSLPRVRRRARAAGCGAF